MAYGGSALVAAFAVAIWWALFSAPGAGFDPQKVISKGRLISSRSWEFGTFAEALLEFYNAELTVFGPDPFPQGLIPQVTDPSKVEGLTYAKAVIWTNGTDLLTDGEGKPTNCLLRNSRGYSRVIEWSVLTGGQAQQQTLHLWGPLPYFSLITTRRTLQLQSGRLTT